MDRKWFHELGLLHIPVSLTGWTLTLLTGFIAVRTFLMVDRYSHSASDTLIGAVPIVAVLFLLLWLVAARSARAGNSN
jgi:hypothetical protein